MRVAVALSLFAASVWLAWPFLTLRTYPHVPGSVYFAQVLLVTAVTVLCVGRSGRRSS